MKLAGSLTAEARAACNAELEEHKLEASAGYRFRTADFVKATTSKAAVLELKEAAELRAAAARPELESADTIAASAASEGVSAGQVSFFYVPLHFTRIMLTI